VDAAAGAFDNARIHYYMAADNWTRSIFRLCLLERPQSLEAAEVCLRFNSFALSRLKSKFALVNGHKPHH
jgi:hypothetical protein